MSLKINFNLMNVGLADNGGSLTLVKSANTLIDMGHEVRMISEVDNKFTWFNLRAEFVKVDMNSIVVPDADAHIATGFNSVRHVCNAHPSKGKRFHWIRAHEAWIMEDPTPVYQAPTVKWVNSVCLQRFIKRVYGAETEILYPGCDFDDFYNTNTDRFDHRNAGIRVGALFNKKPRKRYDWVEKAATLLNNKYGVKVSFWMFGDGGMPINFPSKRFIYRQRPSRKVLREYMNTIHVWLAPTKSEGLHIVPIEAALCGCLVVGTSAPLAGMEDWLADGETGFVSDNNFDSWIKKVVAAIEFPAEDAVVLHNRAYARILKLGSREKNMKRLVDMIKGHL